MATIGLIRSWQKRMHAVKRNASSALEHSLQMSLTHLQEGDHCKVVAKVKPRLDNPPGLSLLVPERRPRKALVSATRASGAPGVAATPAVVQR